MVGREDGRTVGEGYIRTARHMDQAVQLRRGNVPIADLETIAIRFAQNEPDIDYDRLGPAFNRQYWLRNFLKGVLLFEQEKPIQPEDLQKISSYPRITVLGAGSGADAVACMTWLDQYLPLGHTVPLTLVDRSPQQLSIARELIDRARDTYTNAEFSVIYQQTDVQSWIPPKASADIVIMSHLLTEIPDLVGPVVEKVTRAVDGGGKIVVVERERDPIWQTAKHLFLQQGVSVTDAELIPHAVAPLIQSLRDAGIPVDGMTPHYLTADLPEQRYLVDITKKYFEAWRDRDSDLIKEIFASDATYHEKPLEDEPIRGIGDIIGYWQDNPGRQTNIDIGVHAVVYGRNRIHCEFGGDFDTPKQHIKINGAMIFDINHQGQVQDLREYFNTSKNPHMVD